MTRRGATLCQELAQGPPPRDYQRDARSPAADVVYEHMPFLKHLVEGQIGPVTFAEIADGLASVDVSRSRSRVAGGLADPEWREVWQSGGRSGAELLILDRQAAMARSVKSGRQRR